MAVINVMRTTILVGMFLTVLGWSIVGSDWPADADVPSGNAQGREQPCSNREDFRIGSGVHDITGPAAGLGMMGYAQVFQKTRGIHLRLWSRAFVIESPCNGQRVVFVSADLMAIFQAVKHGVIEKLRKEGYGDLYHDRNVLLSATHTHAGPGGYSGYKLYNLTIGGFESDNFNAIVNGIYESIMRAHRDLAPGNIWIKAGTTTCAEDDLAKCRIDQECIGRNRSPKSYLRNPAEERAQYSCNTDTQMTLLKLKHVDGREIGQINWFAVHATSMHNDNRLISSDNKGYASYLFERAKKTDYNSAHTFVAAFAQSNEGDVTPNICGKTDGCGKDQFDNTRISAEKQFNKAVKLYEEAAELVRGGVDYRHAYVNMDSVRVDPQPPPIGDGSLHQTCSAALGISMLAGADDGPGFGWQGVACTKLPKWFEMICNKLSTDCQQPKPIVAKTGSKNPPWTPATMPLQLFKIGQLAIIAVPGEFTTMAGRRVRRTVESQLQPAGIRYSVVAGLSNTYSGYVTTHQEYLEQRYEGASTHFGPWTLAAYQQEFGKIAAALRDGTPVDPGTWPNYPPVKLKHINRNERKPFWKEFGDVRRDAKAEYEPGNTVTVSFWSGHPANDLKTQSSYLLVQQRQGSTWLTVAQDRDWETKFYWRRRLFGTEAKIEWAIPKNAAPGFYRIVHEGSYRSNEKIVNYRGSSRTFQVKAH